MSFLAHSRSLVFVNVIGDKVWGPMRSWKIWSLQTIDAWVEKLKNTVRHQAEGSLDIH